MRKLNFRYEVQIGINSSDKMLQRASSGDGKTFNEISSS